MTAVRAAVLPGPRRPIEIREFPLPRLEPGAAILRTIYSEVCGTDVHLRGGRLEGVPYPIIPGHVSVGVLEAANGAFADPEGRPFRTGDTVAFLDVFGSCGACYYCVEARQTTRCPARRVYGITAGAADGLLGGWAERIWIKPGVRLLPLPEELSPETYIGGGCGAVTAAHAVQRGGVRPGDTVAVLGTGPVGLSAIAFALLAGAGQVIAVGAPADRLRMAERMGATTTLSIDTLPPAARRDRVLALTSGRGADVTIEAAGVPLAVVEGAELCRDGGVLVVAGHYTDGGTVAINPHAHINRKHLDIRGCWGSDLSHFQAAIDAMARHQARFPWADLIARWYSLEETDQALDAVETRAVLKAGVAPNGVRRPA